MQKQWLLSNLSGTKMLMNMISYHCEGSIEDDKSINNGLDDDGASWDKEVWLSCSDHMLTVSLHTCIAFSLCVWLVDTVNWMYRLGYMASCWYLRWRYESILRNLLMCGIWNVISLYVVWTLSTWIRSDVLCSQNTDIVYDGRSRMMMWSGEKLQSTLAVVRCLFIYMHVTHCDMCSTLILTP